MFGQNELSQEILEKKDLITEIDHVLEQIEEDRKEVRSDYNKDYYELYLPYQLSTMLFGGLAFASFADKAINKQTKKRLFGKVIVSVTAALYTYSKFEQGALEIQFHKNDLEELNELFSEYQQELKIEKMALEGLTAISKETNTPSN